MRVESVRKVVAVATMAVGISVGGTACEVHTSGPAPTNAVTAPTASFSTDASVPAVPARPRVSVDLSGSGESVQTANLESGGYTIQYTDTSGYLIVIPVKPDGSDGPAIINADEKSGVTNFHADGPVTLHIQNGDDWSLHFVPLS
jgi:hypothetical protein